MAKRVVVRTPLRLTDIDLEDFIVETRYMAEEMQLILAVLTGFDGKGQRRIKSDRHGNLLTMGYADADIFAELGVIQINTTNLDSTLDRIEPDVGDIADNLTFTWERHFPWDGTIDLSMFETQDDSLPDLLVQGLFHDEYTGDPTYSHVITSIAEILYDCWDQCSRSIRTNEYI